MSYEEGTYIIENDQHVPADRVFHPGWDIQVGDEWEQNTKGFYKIFKPSSAPTRMRRTPKQKLPESGRSRSDGKSHSPGNKRSRKAGGKKRTLKIKRRQRKSKN